MEPTPLELCYSLGQSGDMMQQLLTGRVRLGEQLENTQEIEDGLNKQRSVEETMVQHE